MTTLVIFVEHADGAARRGSLEALGAARAAGADCVAVLCGPGAADVAPGLGPAGATTSVVLTGADAYSADQVAAGIAEVCQAKSATGFIAAASSRGKDLAPRVAAHLDCTIFSDCIELGMEGDKLSVQRPWLAGKVLATLSTAGQAFCATTRLNVFQPHSGEGDAAVEEHGLTSAAKAVVTGVEAKGDAKLDVKEAPVVISGGRGLKEPEGFGIVEELAGAFGNAAVGASRAVVDAGWRPHGEQVGQTGKTVAPQLYIAVGISGAIQHLAGMRTSKVIVAVNKDADAPIFKVADYGIVGDAFEILPALTEAVKAVKAEG